jgi:hypothetical protein
MKSVYAVTWLNNFSASLLGIIVPLFMLERGISPSEIGVAFAFGPLFFTLTRVLFASLSEFLGSRKFFFLNAFLQPFSAIVYLLSNSALGFSLGKVTEGTRDAAIWAVNRKVLYENHGESAERSVVTVRMNALNQLGTALGRLLGGFMITITSFSNALLLTAFVSLSSVYPAMKIPDKSVKREVDFQELGKILNFFSKPLKLKEVAYAYLPYAFFDAIAMSYAIPVFLALESFSLSEIGLLLAGVYVVSGGVSLLVVQSSKLRELALVGLIAGIMGCVGIGLSPDKIAISVCVLAIAASEGFYRLPYETLLAHGMVGSRHLATDNGMVFLPLHLLRFLILLGSGFVAETLGFPLLFSISAVGLVGFTLVSWKHWGKPS